MALHTYKWLFYRLKNNCVIHGTIIGHCMEARRTPHSIAYFIFKVVYRVPAPNRHGSRTGSQLSI